jgi:hypothetical protein
MGPGNELGLSTATAYLIVSALLTVYAVRMLWIGIKRPSSGGLVAVLGMLMFMWLGWMLRSWSGRGSHGLLFTLLIAWKDSILTFIWLLFKMVGASDAWDQLFGQFYGG